MIAEPLSAGADHVTVIWPSPAVSDGAEGAAGAPGVPFSDDDQLLVMLRLLFVRTSTLI